MHRPKLLPTTATSETFAGVTYHLDGELVPVLTIDLAPGLSVYFEHHILLWKNPSVTVDLKPIKGALKRMMAGMQILVTQARGPGQIAFAVPHCTAGDVLIALACYLAASAVTRDVVWPWHRPSSGGAVGIVTGVAYTVFSEWLNASVRGSWAYTESMPRISSLGLTPLLQWLAVPLVTLWLIRAGKRST